MTDVIVRVEHLTVDFGDFRALNDISCEFREGGVVGLIGQNGAGKTTLVHSILGQTTTSGTVFRQDALIAYCPDTPAFEPFLSAREVLAQSSLLAMKPRRLSPREATETLRRVGLADVGSRKIGGFSLGMKQRLGIAAALVLRPRLLFLDEPTSALDPMGREDVLDVIVAAAEETTVVMSSHILDDVQRVASRLLVLDGGNLLYDGLPEDFISSREHDDRVTLRVDGNPLSFVEDLRARGVAAHDVSGTPDQVSIARRDLGATLELLSRTPERLVALSAGEATLQAAFVERLGRARSAA